MAAIPIERRQLLWLRTICTILGSNSGRGTTVCTVEIRGYKDLLNIKKI